MFTISFYEEFDYKCHYIFNKTSWTILQTLKSMGPHHEWVSMQGYEDIMNTGIKLLEYKK